MDIAIIKNNGNNKILENVKGIHDTIKNYELWIDDGWEGYRLYLDKKQIKEIKIL